MKIQYCSDLHLELEENQLFYLEGNIIDPGADILVITGDLIELIDGIFRLDFFDWLSRNFKLVFWIPGNHEYRYEYDISKFENANSNIVMVRHNVFLLNRKSIVIGNTKFIFSTLWSNVTSYPEEILKEVPDYHQNRYLGRKITVKDTNRFFSDSFSYLIKEVKEGGQKNTIVCTHYCPLKETNPEKYKDHNLNEAFFSDLSSEILNIGIDYWIYGHTHHNHPDLSMANTIFVTNQLGYVRDNENVTYHPQKIITVG